MRCAREMGKERKRTMYMQYISSETDNGTRKLVSRDTLQACRSGRARPSRKQLGAWREQFSAQRSLCLARTISYISATKQRAVSYLSLSFASNLTCLNAAEAFESLWNGSDRAASTRRIGEAED